MNESLNSNILTGPDLLANLLELSLRFRENAVGVLADIGGMFMQIAIRPEDQSALRFFGCPITLFSNTSTSASSLVQTVPRSALYLYSVVALKISLHNSPTFCTPCLTIFTWMILSVCLNERNRPLTDEGSAYRQPSWRFSSDKVHLEQQ